MASRLAHHTATALGGNNAPTITAAGALARTQGDGASNATIATVSDDESDAAALTVTVTTIPTGITINSL
ncbi:MAG: hypothetical protein JO360_00100, partial [Acidobacteria bacterium]|nr:hypothetical protein [Acidobacteriota bacterium]